MALTIKTNHQYREFFEWDGLNETERDEKDDQEDGLFFYYKGILYNVEDFIDIEDKSGPFNGWDSYMAESAFSGVLIKMREDEGYIKCGCYFHDVINPKKER